MQNLTVYATPSMGLITPCENKRPFTLAGVASYFKSAFEVRMTPLAWNTLDETATYLTEATGKNWTKNEVLSAAIEYPISIYRNLTFIQVAMPRETRFGICIYDFDMPVVNPFRRIRQHVWIFIRLRQFHVNGLLIHGEIQISDAGNSESVDMLSEGEYVFIEPLGSKHIVNLDMLRIAKNDLKELAHKIKTGARSFLDGPSRETVIANPKKLGRQAQQFQAILATITDLGFEPLKIPDGGKAKIKAICLLNVSLFTDAGFGHAWKAGSSKNLFKLGNAQYYRHASVGS